MVKPKQPKERYMDPSGEPFRKDVLLRYFSLKSQRAQGEGIRGIYRALGTAFSSMGDEIGRGASEDVVRSAVFGNIRSIRAYKDENPDEYTNKMITFRSIIRGLEDGPADWLERTKRGQRGGAVTPSRMRMHDPHFLENEGTDEFNPNDY